MKTREAKIVYVHGHGIHPNRLKLFPAIGSGFIPADYKLPGSTYQTHHKDAQILKFDPIIYLLSRKK